MNSASVNHFRKRSFISEYGRQAGPNAAKIVALRHRLDKLGDDITDSTERFKIEREIFELEQAGAPKADEWPEVISGEGGDS